MLVRVTTLKGGGRSRSGPAYGVAGGFDSRSGPRDDPAPRLRVQKWSVQRARGVFGGVMLVPLTGCGVVVGGKVDPCDGG